MEQEREERADTLFEVADALLSLGSNYRPTIEEVRAQREKIEGPLRSIPTENLLDMLAAAAQKTTPKAPTVGEMLAAWKESPASWRRTPSTQIAIKPASVYGISLHPDGNGSGACAAFLFGQWGKNGKAPVYCNCIYAQSDQWRDGREPEPYTNMFREPVTFQPLAKLSDDKAFWVCAEVAPRKDIIACGPCDFRQAISEGDAMLLRIRAQEMGDAGTPRVRERPSNPKPRTLAVIKAEKAAKEQTGQTVSELADKVRGVIESKTPETASAAAFKIFLSDCGYQSERLSSDDTAALRGFYDWCQAQIPVVNPGRTTFELLWNEYTMDLRAAAEMEMTL